MVNWKFWKPAPKPPKPSGGDSSRIEAGSPSNQPTSPAKSGGGSTGGSSGSGSGSGSGGNRTLGAGGGTYNSSTGVYTDRSGNQFSTASAPSGSLVVGGSTPSFSFNNGARIGGGGSSGGGGGSGSSSVVEPPKQLGGITLKESEVKQMVADKQPDSFGARVMKNIITPPMVQLKNTFTDSYNVGLNKNVKGGVNVVKDFGTQQEILDASGGSALGKGSSIGEAYRSYTRSATPQELEQIKTTINQEKLSSAQEQLKLQQSSLKQLGIKDEGVFSTQELIRRIEDKKMSYNTPDLRDVNIEEIINRSRKNFLGKGGKNYIEPEVATAIISMGNNQRLFEQHDAQTAPQKNRELNVAKLDVQKYANNLQDSINKGELEVEQAEKLLDSYVSTKTSSLEKTYENLDKEWFEKNAGKYTKLNKDILSSISALRTKDKINLPNTLKAVGIGAIIGATAGTGIALLGGTATVAGASVATGLGVAGAGYSAYGAGVTGLGLYGAYKMGNLSIKEIKAELLFGSAMALSSSVGGIAGGYLGSKVGSSILNKVSTSKANEFVKDLNKRIKTDKTLQDKYWTEENLNRGYAIEKINGRDFRIELGKKESILAYKEYMQKGGLPKASKFESYSVKVQNSLKNDLILNLDKQKFLRDIGLDVNNIRGAEIGKAKIDIYGKTRTYNVVGVTRPDGNKMYYTFKVASTGRITNIQVLDFIKSGKNIYANTYSPIKNRVKSIDVKNPAGKLEMFETGSLKYGDTYLFKGKGRLLGQNLIGDKSVALVESKGRVFKVKSKVAGTTQRQLITKVDSPTLQSFKINSPKEVARVLSRELITKEGGVLISKTQSNALDMSYLKNLPNRNVGGLSFTKTFPKSMKLFPQDSNLFNVKPVNAKSSLFKGGSSLKGGDGYKPSVPSMIDMGGKGDSSYAFGNIDFYPTTTPVSVFQIQTNTLVPSSNSYGSMVSSLIKPKLSPPKVTFTQSMNLYQTQGLFTPITLLQTQKKPELKTEMIKPLILSDLRLKENKILFSIPKFDEKTQLKTIVSNRVVTTKKDNVVVLPQTQQGLMPQTLSMPLVKPFKTPQSPPIKFNPQISFTPFFGLPNLGEIQTGGGQRSRPTSVGLFGKTRYNPSLGSVLLRAPKKKVTQAEYESLSQQKFLGLGLRPELEIVSNKKRKRLGLF